MHFCSSNDFADEIVDSSSAETIDFSTSKVMQIAKLCLNERESIIRIPVVLRIVDRVAVVPRLYGTRAARTLATSVNARAQRVFKTSVSQTSGQIKPDFNRWQRRKQRQDKKLIVRVSMGTRRAMSCLSFLYLSSLPSFADVPNPDRWKFEFLIINSLR